MDVERLYNINPIRLRQAAKGRTYEQFVQYLKEQPNFRVIEDMSEEDKKRLYKLCTE